MDWFVLRAALFTTGGRASKGCHLTQLPKPARSEYRAAIEPERHRDHGLCGAGFPSSIHLLVNSMPSSLALCAVSKARPMQLKARTRLMPSLSQHTMTLNFHRLPLLVGSSMR